jgi:hypothetical protein
LFIGGFIVEIRHNSIFPPLFFFKFNINSKYWPKCPSKF